MAHYWVDSREQHGQGRRNIQPADNLRGGLCGGWVDEPAQSRAVPSKQQDPVVIQADQRNDMFRRDLSTTDPHGYMGTGTPQEPVGMPTYNPPGARKMGVEVIETSSVNCDDGDISISIGDQSGRRYIGCNMHMQDAGTSAPVPDRHGRGRRRIDPMDHQVTRADHEELPCPEPGTGAGRRHLVPADHLRSDVMRPVEEIKAAKLPTTEDMKDAIKEWMTAVHGMTIFNERLWIEVVVQPRGINWVIEALTEQRKAISREGPTARAIAEKISMMPVAELRHFGARFAGANEARAPQHREKRAPFEDNPTLISPGMHNVMGRVSRGLQAPTAHELSCSRKDPQDKMRRYIDSGKDHFQGTEVEHGDTPGSHGHTRGTDFHEGLEHGIGHGKRYIGRQDHLFGGCAVADPVDRRRR